MEQIREEKMKDDSKIINHCIFSGDADFILLSLFIHEPNIVLLKKSVNKREYHFEFTKENNFLLFNDISFKRIFRYWIL